MGTQDTGRRQTNEKTPHRKPKRLATWTPPDIFWFTIVFLNINVVISHHIIVCNKLQNRPKTNSENTSPSTSSSTEETQEGWMVEVLMLLNSDHKLNHWNVSWIPLPTTSIDVFSHQI